MRRIIQIMPITQPIVAVFGDEDGEIFRYPILLIALVEEDKYTYVSFMDVDKNGETMLVEDVSNFMGVEFDGKTNDWTEELKIFKKPNERTKEKEKAGQEGKEGEKKN